LAGVTLYSSRHMRRLLVDAGFEVEKITQLTQYKSTDRLLGVIARKA
jgi:hypothetical protein